MADLLARDHGVRLVYKDLPILGPASVLGSKALLAAERQNGRLEIVVENSWDPEAPPRRSGGMGLKNVQHRLEARYGKDASLRVNTEGELFQVSLSFPAETEEKV